MANSAPHNDADEGLAVPARRVTSLALIAGYINAVGVMHLNGIYVGAMTGNSVQFGVTVAGGKWPSLAVILATVWSFFVGGLISSYARRRLAHPAFELVIMAGLVLVAQLSCSNLNNPLIFELPLLVIAMAMQGETISRFGGLSIQTLVMTSNLLKLADALVGRYVCDVSDWQEQVPSRSEVVLPACAWVGFAFGATAGALATLHLTLPLLLPVLLLLGVASDMVATEIRRGRVSTESRAG
jgi:uncharacterized membrane protein YoaK (UPF0700 family)